MARLEKPHCGKSGVPFMNRTTSLFFTTSSMRPRTSVMILFLLLGDAGGELERVKLGAHAPAQCLVDALMLADERLPAEAFRDHPRLIMIAVAGEIDDLDAGVGNPLADQRLDLVGRHRHEFAP